MNTVYDKTFLTSFFTPDEFEFMQHLSDDNYQLDKMFKKQQLYRDSIVQLINILNSDTVSAEEKQSLAQAQQISEIINGNISALQLNMEESDIINKKIMNLLIKIESDSDISESKYIDEITNLKKEISNYIDKSEQIKNSITSNNNTIYTFFNKDIVQKYIKGISFTDDENSSKSLTKRFSSNLFELKDDDIKITENNYCLIISETSRRVFLPYTQKEILKYLEKYPDQYESFEDVVQQEFIYPIDYYLKHSVVSRFRETYSLIRDREAKSVLEAFKMAIDMMFHYDLNPAIIAACKSQEQLENYLDCLKAQNLNNFNDFEIRFEIAPLKV